MTCRYKKVHRAPGRHRQPDDSAQLTCILADHWACKASFAIVPPYAG